MKGKRLGMRIKATAYNLSSVFILVSIMLLFSIIIKVVNGQTFMTPSNLSVIINQAAFLAVLGVAQMLTILVGGINLSIGSVMAFTTMLCGPLLLESNNYSPFLAPVIMIIVGTLVGIFNGFLITKVKLPAFIATFGTMYIVRGVTWIIAGNTVYFRINPAIRTLTQGQVLNVFNFSINMPVIVCAIVLVIFTLLLRRTVFGRNVYFTGSNPTAARFSGIAVDKLIITMYALAGTMSGFCGVLFAARMNACEANMYTDSHFTAVSVALLSGVSMAGGFGNIWACAIGALIIAGIQNGMNLLRVPSELQTLVLGVLIILSVFFNERLIRKRMDLVSQLEGDA